MKNRKRNIALLSVLMCVAAAVLLNWSYNNRWGKADRVMAAAEDELMAEANAATSASINSGYFAEARLTRQISRDEALQLLQSAASADAASQETIDRSSSAAKNTHSSGKIFSFAIRPTTYRSPSLL